MGPSPRMPGLYDAASWAQLPLEASCVSACANGYSLGLSAHLTYLNAGGDTVQAVFVYLLEEGEVVTSFEAVTGDRKVRAEVQSQSRMEECCSDCPGGALPCCCPKGHLVLDTDTARGSFVLSVGAVPPSAVLTVFLQSSRALQTLPGGAVRVTLNSTLTPLAPPPEGPGEAGEGLCDDSPTSCFGGVSGGGGSPWVLHTDPLPRAVPPTSTGSLFAALTRPATNRTRYQFSFRLQVQGPCLLAGIESPSHSFRADASPFALSASSVWISLAEEYQCDRALEIILHPSEPHRAHLLLECGAMSFSQYEAQIKARRDYIRVARKSCDYDRQVSFVQKRFHKDLPLTPVLMLNFCPDLTSLGSLASDLPSVTREVVFLVHQMGDASHSVQDALLLAVRSLPPRTLLNVVCGGCDGKALFPTSRPCSNDTLALASDYIRRDRLDLGASNLLSVLGRVLVLPVHRGYPRQLFLFTDAAVSCPGRFIELVRRHSGTTRVFGFGRCSGLSRRVLERAARVSGGTVELLNEEERLQPKLIKSLKKALEPALSDITIDWYVPDTMEALLTPNEIAPLYPGDSLIGYCALYHMASFRGRRGAVSWGAEGDVSNTCFSLGGSCDSALLFQVRGGRGGSIGSVFQSADESQTLGDTDTTPPGPSTGSEGMGRALQEISREISMEFSVWSEDPEKSGDGAPLSDIRRRIVQLSYVQDQYVLTHCSVSTDHTPAQTHPSISSDPTHAPTHGSTSSESVGSRDAPSEDCTPPHTATVSQQGQRSVSQSEGVRGPPRNTTSPRKASVTQSSEELVRRKHLIQATMSGRSFSSPQGELDMLRLRNVLDKVSPGRELEPSVRNAPGSGLADSCHLLSPSQLDWDMLVDPQYLFSASPGAEGGSAVSGGSSDPVRQCRAVIRGYVGGRCLSWEASADLEPIVCSVGEETGAPPGGEQERGCDLHHLTARSVIHDHEDTAGRECDIEHGSSRRFRLKAVQTSKSSSQISTFTCHVPVDSGTQEILPGHLPVRRGGRRRRSLAKTCVTADEAPLSSPLSLSSGCSWEAQHGQEGHVLSAGISQKSSDTSLTSRFSFGKRLRSASGKLSPVKPPCLSGESERSLEPGTQDYLPLISLQSSEGFFPLNSCFSGAVQISVQRLLRASPYSCHRGSLSPVSESCPLEQGDSLRGGALTFKGSSHPQVPAIRAHSSLPPHPSSCPEALCHQADSGRGSETDPCEISPCPSETSTDAETDLEGCSWATAVALAWLEHRCAGFFTEWELLAARAEGWLRAQALPAGLQLAALKGAARQLFLLLRHWDENLNLNVLCYNPGDV